MNEMDDSETQDRECDKEKLGGDKGRKRNKESENSPSNLK